MTRPLLIILITRLVRRRRSPAACVARIRQYGRKP